MASKKEQIEEKRYSLLGPLLGSIKASLKWANAQAVKEELDVQLLALLGPKDERDDPKAKV